MDGRVDGERLTSLRLPALQLDRAGTARYGMGYGSMLLVDLPPPSTAMVWALIPSLRLNYY